MAGALTDDSAPPLESMLPPGPRVLRLLLGQPRPNREESTERLGNPSALAILSSDALSSVAYANEEMLRVLLPVAAAASFGLVMPIALAIVALLVTLVFSYRQTIRAYPSAGGAYIVTRDNFGVLLAQVAGVGLLLDYVMTVAVSVSSGVAALYSQFPALFALKIPLAVALIWLMAWGNLRGVRATGKLFAIPTYLFLASMFGIVAVGLVKLLAGNAHPIPTPDPLPAGTAAVGLFVLAHAYASGTTALTGVEAISNGVPVFRPTEWRNARKVLTWMGAVLAAMFVGLSVLTWKLHPVPSEKQTLLYQLGRAAFGPSPMGKAGLLISQVMTTAILILAANTSFADFPRLASFHAGDGYLPRPFRRRGRRLALSNGIITLALVSTFVTIVLGADVHRLIPLFAVGAFSSFLFSQAGMTRRHLRLREEGWRHSLLINGLGAAGSAIALCAIFVTKFAHGAWVVVVIVPGGVGLFLAVHRHYERVDQRLADPGPTDPSRPSAVALVDVVAADVDDGAARSPAFRFTVVTDRAVLSLRTRAGSILKQIAELAHPAQGRWVAVHLPAVTKSHRGASVGPIARLRRRSLQRRLRRLPGVLTVTDRSGEVGAPGDVDHPGPTERPWRDALVVVVEAADARARHAVALADLTAADEVHVVVVDRDRQQTDTLIDDWPSHRFGAELEVVGAPYREPGGPVAWKVAALRASGADWVTIVIPKLEPRWWQRPLHERPLRPISAALQDRRNLSIITMPYPI